MKLEDKAGHPAAAGGRNYRITIALLLALIVFGSLYPLTWNFAQPQDFIFRGPVGLVDLLKNVILFLPLDWLLGWNDLPTAMSCLPFASSLSGSIEAVVTSVAFESLFFGHHLEHRAQRRGTRRDDGRRGYRRPGQKPSRQAR